MTARVHKTLYSANTETTYIHLYLHLKCKLVVLTLCLNNRMNIISAV